MKTEIIKFLPRRPERIKLLKAVEVLRNGGVIVFPTDTVYGLAANAAIDEAQKKIFKLKGRSFKKPLIIMADRTEILEDFVKIPSKANALIEKHWPGPLTLILPATKFGSQKMRGRKDIGVRIPDNVIALELLRLCSFPLVTTSANPSNSPSAKSGIEAINYFQNKVELIIDNGPCLNGIESTVLDVTKSPFKIIREGCLSKDKLGL